MVGVPGFEPGSYAPKACMLAVAPYPEVHRYQHRIMLSYMYIRNLNLSMTPEGPQAPKTVELRKISEIAARVAPEYKTWARDKAGSIASTAIQEKLEEVLNGVMQELDLANIKVTEDDIDATTEDSEIPGVEDGVLYAFDQQIKFSCYRDEVGPVYFDGDVEEFFSTVITEILLRNGVKTVQ